MSSTEGTSSLRLRLHEFLMESAARLQVTPIVKYSALSLFADRFYSCFLRLQPDSYIANWLLQPMRESNLQLFALVSIWLSSKVHNSPALSVKYFKCFGDKVIKEQHFTTRDFLEAELIFMQALNFEIGMRNIAYTFLEELLFQLKSVAIVGDLVKVEACMDTMDLLYEKEEMMVLFSSPRSLAASILVASYVITIPRQRWEFPILSWEDGKGKREARRRTELEATDAWRGEAMHVRTAMDATGWAGLEERRGVFRTRDGREDGDGSDGLGWGCDGEDGTNATDGTNADGRHKRRRTA